MVFEHNPGLAFLHSVVTGEETNAAEAAEAKTEIEEITKEIQEDARLDRPQWQMPENIPSAPRIDWRGFGR